MKKRRLLVVAILVIAWLFVPWSTLRATEYVKATFDAQMPAGWTEASNSFGVKWLYNSDGFEGGCMQLWCPYNIDNLGAKLYTPEFTIATSRATLDFKYSLNSSASCNFSVMITADGGTKWDTLRTKMPQSWNWSDVSVSLSKYASQTVKIAFVGESMPAQNPTIGLSVDNVLIEDFPLCKKPVDIELSALSQTSASIRWALSSGENSPSQYKLTVRKMSDGSEVLSKDVILDNENNRTTDISPLDKGTEYSVKLVSDCNSDDSPGGFSDPTEFVFATLLDPIKLSYRKDFDDEARFPIGWTAIGDVSVTSEKYYGNSGNSMSLATDGKTSAMVVLPQFDHNVNDIQFKAYVSADVSTKYKVGFISDVMDVTTFDPLFSDSVESSDWFEIRFNTSDYVTDPEAGNLSLAIFLQDGYRTTMNIDNIDVTPIPTCPRPEDLAVDYVDSTLVMLSWRGKSDKYQVSLESAAGTEYRVVTGKPAKVDNLLPNTDYSIKVRDICADADTSEWSPNEVKFRTLCGTTAMQMYIFESDALPECWMQKQTVKGSGWGYDHGNEAWDISGDKAYSGNYSLRLKDQMVGTHTILALQPVHVDRSGVYDLSFYYYRNEYKQYPEEGIAVWINNRPDLEGGQKLAFLPGGYTHAPTEPREGWYKYNYNINLDGSVYVIFEGINQNGSKLYIDDIQVAVAPTCPRVISQSVVYTDPVDDKTLSMKWDAADSETEWALRYELRWGLGSKSDTVVIKGTPEYKFENLVEGDTYELSGSVAAICGVADTSEFVEFGHKCTVPCSNDLIVPFTESFETTNRLPNCWTSKQTAPAEGAGGNDYGDEAWMTIESSFASSGSRVMQLRDSKKGIHTILVPPAFTIPDEGKWMVQLYVFRDNASWSKDEGVRVWINTKPDTEGATKLLDIQHGMQFEPKEVEEGTLCYNAPITTTGRQYLIIEGISQNSRPTHIDDVSILPMPDCMPIARDVRLDSVSHDAVRLFISEDVAWEVECCEKGAALGTGRRLDSTDSTILVSSLNPDTDYEYDIYARRKCGDSYSEWRKNTKSITFRTLCEPYSVTAASPYFDGFEDLEIGSKINSCYANVHVAGSDEFSAQESFTQYGDFHPYEGDRFVIRKYSQESWTFRSMYLRAGVYYEASGYFKQDGTNNKSTQAAIAVATTPDVASIFIRPTETEAILDTWQRVAGYFMVPADGIYYVGWYVNQNSVPYRHAMDNLGVREVPCIPPSSSDVSRIRSNSVVVNWNTDAGSMWELKVAETAIAPDATSGLVYHDTLTTSFADVTQLKSNTEYHYYLRSICDKTPSDWTKMYTFRTLCDKVDVPFTEDFEDETFEKFGCWTVSKISSSQSQCSYSTMQHYTGAASLKFKSCEMVTPELNVTSLSDYMITGWVRTQVDSVRFTVGVMEDLENPNSFEEVSVILVPKKSVWQEFTAYFTMLDDPDFAGYNPKFISITSSSDADIFFDDIMVGDIPSCLKPTETVITDIAPESFKLGWKTNGKESRWQVLVNKDGAFAFDTVVDRNPSTIVGLTPVSEYEVSMRAICGVADTSATVLVGSFATPCAPYGAPYDLFLDSDDGSALPQCWALGRGNSGGGANDWSVAASGDNAYLRYSNYGRYEKYYSNLLTPIFDLTDASSASMHASLLNSSAADTLFIRLSLDGGNTFPVELDTVPPSDTKVTLDCDLVDYVGRQIVFAFEANGGKSYGSKTEIYSFGISTDEPCSRPDSVRIETVSDTEVSFAIVDKVADHTAWQVVYGAKGFDYHRATPKDVAQTFSIDALQARSTYYLYARTKCTDGTFSAWRGPVKFSTACPVVATLPYKESFEYPSDDKICVEFLNAGTDEEYSYMKYETIYLPSYRLYPGYSTDGTNVLELTSSDEEPLFMVFPAVEEPVNSVKVSFDYHHVSLVGASELVLGVITDIADTTTFVPVQRYGAEILYRSVEYHFNSFAQQFAEGARIAIKLTSSEQSEKQVRIDNLSITKDSPCPYISRYELLEVTSTTATIVTDCLADSIECVYGIAGTAADDCLSSLVEKTDTVDLTLTAGTAYYVYFRSLCGPDTGLWTSPLLVSTPCEVKSLAKGDRWVENFDTHGDGTLFPACFTPVATAVDKDVLYPLIDKTYAVKNQALHFKGPNIVALPEFDLPADRLMVSFSAKGSQQHVNIGMMDVLHPDSAITKIGSVYATPGSPARGTFDLSLTGDEGRYVVIYTTTQLADLSIDSLVVEWAPTCYAPRNLNVMAGDTTASVSWRGAPDATKYEYSLVSQHGTETKSVTTTAFELKPLLPLTKYTLSVRSICGTGIDAETTEWTSASFSTLANVTKMPFVADFEDEDDNLKWQYVQDTDDSKNIWVIGTDAAAVKAGEKSLYMSSDGTTYAYDIQKQRTSQHAYRTLYLEPGYYYCAYDWQCAGEPGYDYATVNLVPVGRTITVGVPLNPMISEDIIGLQEGRELANNKSWKSVYKSFEIKAAGYYNLVFSWKNDYSGGDQPTIAIDNLSMDKIECDRLTSVTVDSVSATSLFVSVVNPNDDAMIEYRLLSGEDVILSDIIEGDTVKIEGSLTPNTDYILEARPYCGEGIYSPYSRVEITTLCLPADIPDGAPYVDGFESYTVDKSRLSNCWMSTVNWEVRTQKDDQKREPYQGNNYLTVGCNVSDYVYTEFNLQGGKYYSVSVMARQDVTGGCLLEMISHDDTDGVIVLGSGYVADKWVKISGDIYVPATGICRLGFKATLDNRPYYLCLDDFTVSAVPFGRPSALKFDSVGVDYAAISWQGAAERYQVQILDGEDVIEDTTVTKLSVRIDGLQSSSLYNLRARSISGEDTSEWVSIPFYTECDFMSLPYDEDFTATAVGQIPYCWDNITGSKPQNDENWQVLTANSDNALGLIVSKAQGIMEVRSPFLRIDDASAHLSFDYINESQYDTLHVKVIHDDGASVDTLLSAINVSRFTPAMLPLADYVGQDVIVALSTRASYRNLTDRMVVDHFHVACLDDDLTVFDTICPLFKQDEPYRNDGFEIPVEQLSTGGDYTFRRLIRADGNDRCDYYKELRLHVRNGGMHYLTATICEGREYTSEAFPTPLTEAKTYVSRPLPSTDGCDSVVTLTLSITKPASDIYHTICQGASYPFAGRDLTTSGTYYDTVPSYHKCDSVITLHLSVAPKYFEDTLTVCAGTSYTWHVGGKDTILTTTGRYEKVFENVHRCDSIEVLNFTVLPDYVRIDSTICFGQRVRHGTEVYSTTGVYPVVLENELKCKYTSELHLTVLDPDTVSETDYACQDKEYYGYGFQGITVTRDTMLVRATPDADGCITVTRVALDYTPTVEVFDTVEIQPGGSYNFCGDTHTKAGTYHCTAQASTGCDSITHLTLVIATGTDHTTALPLILAPNPVGIDDITYIHRTWTPEEQHGLTVEILNSVGQVLTSYHPEYYPIAIRSLHVAGIYHIRITTGTGDVYLGRLIVR